MTAYYNEIEPAAAHVLRALIADGVIAPGDVDERSIKDVQPSDLKGYTQCHFFAGGGLWSIAARLAGWPDDRSLWTGSCPCQPFSVAGKGAGQDDPRHLWPDFFRLISSRRPAVVVGEQVAGAAGYGWFDGVAADLEREGYASRAVDIPACAVNAPHIRQRLYWIATNLADAGYLCGRNWPQSDAAQFSPSARLSSSCSDMGNASSERLEGFSIARNDGQSGDGKEIIKVSGEGCGSINMADANGGGCAGWQESQERRQKQGTAAERVGFWDDTEWLTGADGKTRRSQPGVRLLVDGLPGRVGLLRIGGNAIVPQVAAQVLAAMMEVTP